MALSWAYKLSSSSFAHSGIIYFGSLFLWWSASHSFILSYPSTHFVRWTTLAGAIRVKFARGALSVSRLGRHQKAKRERGNAKAVKEAALHQTRIETARVDRMETLQSHAANTFSQRRLIKQARGTLMLDAFTSDRLRMDERWKIRIELEIIPLINYLHIVYRI